MTSSRDDFPHPVPPIASLRWKENYFLILASPDQEIFGVGHFNHEPGFNRARCSLGLDVAGKRYHYSWEGAFPENFEQARAVGDERLSLHLPNADRHFRLELRHDDVAADIYFDPRFSTFDYVACEHAAPAMPSFREVMSFGTNLPYRHQQQALTAVGEIRLSGPESERQILVRGSGYRDHSWCMRADALVAWHSWSVFSFRSRVIAVKTAMTLHRPGLIAKEGYATDAGGAFPLVSADMKLSGDTDGLPDRILYEVRDAADRVFTIEAHIAGRMADIPLVSEKPGGSRPYSIREIFCRCRLLETGEAGWALVELGANPKWEGRKW